jgi:hypothetical protein
MRNPFSKKKDPLSDTERMLHLEAGLTEIKGTEHLKRRIGFTEEEIDELIKDYNRQLSILLRLANPSQDQKQHIEALTLYITNWHIAKMVTKSATPWLRSGDSREMSERYASFCHFFGRNWKKPNMQDLLTTCGLYLHGISHIDPDVKSPPTIFIQTPVMGGSHFGGDELAEATRRKFKAESVP